METINSWLYWHFVCCWAKIVNLILCWRFHIQQLVGFSVYYRFWHHCVACCISISSSNADDLLQIIFFANMFNEHCSSQVKTVSTGPSLSRSDFIQTEISAIEVVSSGTNCSWLFFHSYFSHVFFFSNLKNISVPQKLFANLCKYQTNMRMIHSKYFQEKNCVECEKGFNHHSHFIFRKRTKSFFGNTFDCIPRFSVLI